MLEISNYFSNNWLCVDNSEIKVTEAANKSSFDCWENVVFFVNRLIELLTNGKSSIIRVSRHLMKSCDETDLTSLTHKQLTDILNGLKLANEKIYRHNQKNWIPLLNAPVLDLQISRLQNRLNATALNKTVQNMMYFPKQQEYLGLNPKEISEGWQRNNELLLGCIASHTITPFGFSGQVADGVNKLLDTRASGSDAMKNHIWATGYNYQLDPITFLADLTILAKTAYSYSYPRDKLYGGVFIINTTGETAYSEKVGSSDTLEQLTDANKNYIESEKIVKFINLACRRKDWDPPRYKEFPQTGLIKTLDIPTANEMTLQFDQTNYSQRVFGVITRDQFAYADSFLSDLYHDTQVKFNQEGVDAAIVQFHRLYLGYRLNYQQIILHAFEKMGLFDNVTTPAQLEKYRTKGAELMEQIDEKTQIDAEELKKLAGSHWYVTPSSYWYL